MIVDMLVGNGVAIGFTPFDFLEQLKNQFGLNQADVLSIKSLLDYAMILNETYIHQSYDVLSACIGIFESMKNSN